MQLYGAPPLKHVHQCWRYASHWRCAVDLVERLAEAGDDLVRALDRAFDPEDIPDELTAAADELLAALQDAGYRMPQEARQDAQPTGS